ncbi:glycoside hydrolase family 16 protein [Serendipita vermifera MAFF 305830]|uniref:Glycoside hydrolase family 16 protein n=1 Tax=Serendipita vermifera MAFF 305830 TaxID=933852 RepID=A0A0C3B3Q4_SERVB|nr:glycoside hydrolase family 16 protein [Serendipita vermifera MAFF 305830]
MISQPACYLAVLLSFALSTQATTYSLTDKWVGKSFLEAFSWEAIADPTNGRVNYVSQDISLAQNLTYASDSHFILKADSTSVLTATGPGRNSNRIQSYKRFGHNTVLVADINRMPIGCGTWPALWSTDVSDWPTYGEIDIIEGVNDVPPNAVSLHTTANCSLPSTVPEASGQIVNTDCNWLTNGNSGCNFASTSTNSYGPAFNADGGGWYAMERTPEYIKVWFWSRQDSANVPLDVKEIDQGQIDTSGWGVPFAFFPNTNCDISSKFAEHNIIINLTFCGDWAGNVYTNNGCPGTCVDYVENNPAAFADAIWDFNSITMYGNQSPSGATATSSITSDTEVPSVTSTIGNTDSTSSIESTSVLSITTSSTETSESESTSITYFTDPTSSVMVMTCYPPAATGSVP